MRRERPSGPADRPAMPGRESLCCAAADASCASPSAARSGSVDGFTVRVLSLFGIVVGAVLLVVVLGEWLGLFEVYTRRVPWPVGLSLVLLGGYPVFRNVVRAAVRRRVTSHTLMTVGAVAALTLGEWATAMVVVLFMRVSDFAERFTTDRARRAIRTLAALAPRTARVARAGGEVEVPLDDVRPGETVVVRPGEQVPVDGEVIAGHATVDQSTITGESMPADVGPGTRVFAASLTRLGSLRVRTTHVGPDTTFGRIVRMVEEAEAHRGEVQRWADRFSARYLPVVVAIAGLTLAVRQDVLASAAVLVVACSCSFALATPVAMLASIGASARRGLLVKGGRYLEALARADVVLIDKTGTLTLGRPRIETILPLNGMPEAEILALAAAAEHDSEHPLAAAVRLAARDRGLTVRAPAEFEALPGIGVRARVNGSTIAVGNPRTIALEPALTAAAADLEARGTSVLLVTRDGEPIGLLAAADTPRPEVPAAVAALRRLGVRHIEILTGDNARVAGTLASALGVAYRAELLPEDKIAVVRQLQAEGRVVVMVGDGVNDAPALAQADAGIAMGAAGTDVALEAAHIALMREDWALVPEAVRIARRTMRVVKLNIAFTALYNLVGVTLAALGFLPLVVAAAAQSLPDVGIVANSSRLLRQRYGIARAGTG